MIVNCKVNQKSKTILGVIRNIVHDFILYFVTAYIAWDEKVPYTCNMSTMVEHQIHYTSL